MILKDILNFILSFFKPKAQPQPQQSAAPIPPKLTINQAGINLIKSFESCKLTAYEDGGGVWTIGWGHTQGVTSGMTCTQAQADQWFMDDIAETERMVRGLVPATINQNQFSACVSLAYNIGVGNFAHSSLLKYIRGTDFQSASAQFLVWDKIQGKENDGLLRRRKAEQQLFNTPA